MNNVKNPIVACKVVGVDAQRVREQARRNENIISMDVECVYGRNIIVVIAKVLPNKRYFGGVLAVKLEDLENMKVLQISNTGMIDDMPWMMEDSFGAPYLFYQIVVIDDNGKRVLAEGDYAFCSKCLDETRREFGRVRKRDLKERIYELLDEAEGLKVWGDAKAEKIEVLTRKACDMSYWLEHEEGRSIREMCSKAQELRIGDTLLATPLCLKPVAKQERVATAVK